MKEDKKVPQLRFPEFTDAWKQRKFGDVLVSIQTGTNKLGSDRNSGQPLLKMGNLQSGYFDLSKLEFLENKAEPENIVKQGDFFFNTRNTLELVGKGATWFGESNKYAFNSNIARFTLKDINTGFFNYLYNTNYVKKQIRARAMGTTSVAAIYPRSLKSVDIVIPNMEEQIKLSNLFMNLDSTITLQQRKLNSLQKLKKGLLQKMFPKNGENIPEIRFPEFSDAWKQRKLGEIIDYSNGIGHENYVLPQGKYELVTLKSINSSGKLVCSEKFVNEDFETLKAETLIMMLSEQAKGMLGMTTIIPCDNKYVLNQRVAALKAHNDVEVHFLTNAINNKQNYFEQMGAGTKVQNITRGHVEECVIELPSLEEQKKIGSLFSKLEVTITLQQCKLESLQKLKKGLLQQMFI